MREKKVDFPELLEEKGTASSAFRRSLHPAAGSGSLGETEPFLGRCRCRGLGGEAPTSSVKPLPCSSQVQEKKMAMARLRRFGSRGGLTSKQGGGGGGVLWCVPGRLFGKGGLPVVEQAEKLIQSNPPHLQRLSAFLTAWPSLLPPSTVRCVVFSKSTCPFCDMAKSVSGQVAGRADSEGLHVP